MLGKTHSSPWSLVSLVLSPSAYRAFIGDGKLQVQSSQCQKGLRVTHTHTHIHGLVNACCHQVSLKSLLKIQGWS